MNSGQVQSNGLGKNLFDAYAKPSYSNRLGFKQIYKIYGSKSCKGCPFKDRCFYNYTEEKHKNVNRKMRINHNWEKIKLAANDNIHSEQGIFKRQLRSIQTEGTF